MFKKNLKAVLHFFLFSLFASTSLSAYSEVTISGTVDQAYETVKLTNITGKLKINRIEPTLSNYNELKFTGSENLGPGLKAIFEISFKDVGPDDTDKIASNYTSFVGLEGGFGKLKIGQQWRPMFNAVAYVDPTQLVYVPGFVGTSAGLATTPLSNSITYNLPSFIPGVFVQYQKGYGETSTRQGDSTGLNLIFTDGEKFFIAYATNVEKMNSVGNFEGAAAGTSTVAQLGPLSPYFTIYDSTNGGERRMASGVAASYNFGPFKLVYGNLSEKVEGTVAKQDTEVMGVKIPLAQSLDFGYIKTKSDNKRGSGALTGTNFTQSGNRMLFTYGLSKRTTAYFAKGQVKYDGRILGSEFKTSIDALGIQHKF
jgi:hypothetical protein